MEAVDLSYNNSESLRNIAIMAKERMIKMKCLNCHKDIKTTAMKAINERYQCPACGHWHSVGYDEVEETWFPQDAKLHKNS